MMRNIGGLFERRKNSLNRSQDRSKLIKNILQEFLTQRFGDNLKGLSFNIEFNPKNNNLTITTDNKIIANELSLQLHDLAGHLKANKIALNSILIR
jgi:hypothetical protein